MKVYVYCAALYCEDCGEAICEALTAEGKRPPEANDEGSFDSNDYPKGPTDEGESDTPSHCDACHEFLETDLTDEGREYAERLAREAFAKGQLDSISLTVWAPFYGFEVTL